MEFPRVTKKECGISKGSNTSSWNYQGWSLVLSGISRGKVKKRKITGFFKKVHTMKYVPVCFFSRILLQNIAF